MRALQRFAPALLVGLAAAGPALPWTGEFPTDRVIVRVKPDGAAAKRAIPRDEMATLAGRELGEKLEFHREMGDGALVMRLPRRMAPSQISARAKAFAVDGATVGIEPDRIAFPQQSFPNDPFYGNQWNLRLEGINLPPAWGTTTGSGSLVIAILDTGMLPHADLAGRYLPGHDFIGDTNRANDGDGREANATDPGDWVTAEESASGPLAGCPVTDSRWHGTLMAGVIAANGNNALKIAGINWGSKLLPVRVVGKCGGYTSDIADGMRWAAGLSVPGVPDNPNPAKVLNVSLAAQSATCESAFAGAIAEVTTQKKATIVVSAGNASGAASQYAPGNCAGVITVGATDIRGGRPGYANTGDPIALSAPGGEGSGPGSVITLSDGGSTTAANDGIHVGTNGTSIAAAHVTGVASLLLSLRPNLTPAQVRDVMVTNARAFPANAQASGSFANCTPAQCGAGILDALAAIRVVNDPEAGLPDVAAGGDHTLALKSDGTLFAWGRNDKGQLGDGTTTDRLTPIVVPLDGVTRIAAGGTARGLLDPEAFGLRNSFFSGAHSLAVRVDGSVWSWGSNSFGELGLGTIGEPVLQPTRVPGLRDVVAVSAGLNHSLALTRQGTVWAWGANTGGLLGTGTTVDQALPAPVLSLTNVTSIAAGSRYSCATRSDGTVWCWGDFFPLNGSTFGSQIQPVPTQVTNFANPVLRTAAGPDALHRVFYDPANFLSPRAIGNSRQGQTGVAPTTSHVFASPNALAAGSSYTFRQFAVGRNHTIGVDEVDFVWAWGNDIEGQLGDGKAPGEANGAFRSAKVLVRNSQETYRVAAGGDRGVGVRRDGSVYSWGAGLLGDGIDSTRTGQGEPVLVRGVGGIGNLDLGSVPPAGTAYFSPGLVSRYGVPAGQTVVSNAITVLQSGPFSVTVVGGEISVGCATGWTTNATLTSGNVVCLRGMAPAAISDTPSVVEVQFLGFPIATWPIYSSPRRINPDPFPIAPVSGAAPSSVVTSAPVVVRGINVASPILTTGGATVSPGCTGSFVGSGVASVTDGQSLCVRLTAPATAGTTVAATIAVGATNSIFNVTTAAPAFVAQPAIAAAGFYALALNRTGNAFAWGDNSFGQFGTVSAGDGLTPVPSMPMPALKAIDANTDHAVAIASDGSVWTWGLADRAQAGDRTIYERSIPPYARRVVLPSPAASVSVGAYHTLVLLANGSLWGWGYNGDLQLTNACAALYCPQPVQIEGPGGGAAAVVAGVFNSYRIAVTSVVSCVGKCYTVVNGSPAYYSTGTFDPFNTFLGGGIAEIAISKSRSNTLYPQAHYLARTLTGAVVAWGANGSGQVGNGSTDFSNIGVFPPVSVSGISNVTRIAAGANHSLALLGDGTVRAWGSNFTGALGDGTTTDRLAPVPVQGFTGAIAIAAGTGSSFALKPDGTILGWGYAGQMGRGIFFEQNQVLPSPVLGVGGMGILNIGVQDDTVFAPQTDVPVSSVRISNAIVGNWAAGSAISITTTGTGPAAEYSIGCLGTFTSAPGTIGAGQSVCVRLTSAPTLTTLRTATLAIAGVGRAFNVSTLQGDGTPDPFRIAPVAAQPLNTVVESEPFTITGIDAGVSITVGGGEISIGCNGTWDTSGAIAPNQPLCVRRVSAATPDTVVTATVSVGGVSAEFHVITSPGASFTATPAIAGYGAPLALRSDGRLFGWGGFFDVNGAFRQRIAPELLSTLSGVKAISKSQEHALALRSDGTVWAWGSNVNGELGDGSNNASDVPLRVPLPGPPALPFVAVAAGVGHSMALRSDGVVYAWGSNTSGQLGDGTQLDRKLPVPMVALTGISAIAAGNNISLAVKQPGGSVLCHGSCPGGSFPPYVTPFTVASLANVVAVSAGVFNSQFALALRQDGVVLGWGENTFGQLGTTGNFVYPPLPVAGLPAVSAIWAGGAHSLARTASGALYTFGANECGQLGLGNSPTDGTAIARSTPTLVPEAAGAAGISGGTNASFALLDDGAVLAWGCQAGGLLGNGQDNPEAITLPVRTLGVDGDGYLSLQFVDTSPDPFAFPARFGVDPGSTVQSNTVRITGLSASAPVSITGGVYAKNCAGGFTGGPGSIASNETICVQVTSPGSFESSATATLTIGTGAGARSAAFTVRTRRASGSAPIAPQVALGNAHSLILAANGTVSGAGYNANGQLGNGTTLNTPTALRVPGFTGVRRIASGAYHSLAVNGNGTVSSWGFNAVGQLGLGAADNVRANPTPVPGLSNVVAVAAGDFHSLALLQDGTVRAWGFNTYGQLGNGNTTNQLSPVPVSALSGVIAIAAGGQHSLALKSDGTVVAWGANDSGQLGDGSTIARSLPVAVSGLSAPATANVVALAAGTSHALALRRDGTVWSWGANTQGQLGLGNTTPTLTPVQVTGIGASVGLIAAGGNHSLAVKAGGALFSWGANASGQLGDGLSANRTTPFAVTTPAQATAIAAGARHSAAIDATGKVFLWGDNFFGQVGNRTGNFNPHAASLNVLRGDSRISAGAGGTGGGTGTASSAGSAVLNLGGLDGGFTFGALPIGQPASAPVSYQNVTDTTSIGSLAISASGAGYSIGGACPGSLAPTQSCSFSIDFSAPSSGYFPGQLRIDSDLVGAPEFRELEATVVAAQSAALTVASTTASFPPTVVGTVSAAVAVTVTNAGTATLSVTSASSASTHFGVANGCASVAPGANCTLAITFAPPAVGTSSGALSVVSNGGNVQIALLGTGIAAPYDSVPDAFTFPAAPGVQPLAFVTSAPVAITGLGGATPVSVQGGEYSVGCTSPFTSAPGTVANGQAVCVRHVAAATTSTQVTTVLTVGGVSGSFTSTTTSVPSNALVTVTFGGNGPGTVTSIPIGINCAVDCTAAFTLGATVTLTATPSPGFFFAGWSGACTGVGACSFAVDGDKAVTATFATAASLPRLANISTRMQVLTGDNVLIGGFIIGGSQPKTVVVRARGPSLAPFGIANFLANPKLDLFSGQTVIATNDDWQQASNAAVLQSSGFAPTDSREAAIHTTLVPGAYTAIVSGVGNSTGVGIVEVFEVDLPQVPLANISTRGQVLTNDDVMIGGFIIQGDTPQTVIVRARGPSLAPFGIANFLANPVLQLFSGQAQIAVNDNWQAATNAAQIQARGFAPPDALESAILVTLTPGAYTAIVTGAGGTTGVGIIEVFAQ